MSLAKSRFRTEGILRKNNLADVPKKNEALTNILNNALGDPNGTYIYDDISIVNGINTFGDIYTSFQRVRDLGRLQNVEVDDLGKVLVNDKFPKADPLQTINNRLERMKVDIGDGFTTGGGDGLLAQYYNWPEIYGDATDVISLGGGTFVENQNFSDLINQTAYFSPNTAVAPSDSEAFFEFSAADLEGKNATFTEVGWNNGVFNYEDEFHPSVVNQYGAAIIKYSGYYTTGYGDYGDGDPQQVEIGKDGDDRIILTSKSSRFEDSDIKFTKSTIPVIVKMWEVNQKTGERLTSDNSPLLVTRYAPGRNSPDFTDVDGDNPPMYNFTNPNGQGINEGYQGANNTNTSTNLSRIGSGVIIAPGIDSSPGNSLRNPYINPFKSDTFYSIEMYFILPPRLAALPEYKSVFIEGYNRDQFYGKVLQKDRFFSKNPFQTGNKKGTLAKVLEQTISRFGSKVSGKAFRLGVSASPNFKSHIQSVGFESPERYNRLFSDNRIEITYKPPHSWNEIARARFVGKNLGAQFESPHQFHYVVWGLDQKNGRANRTDGGIPAFADNDQLVTVGNLVIDYNSPKPRKEKLGTIDGSVFAPFTYIDKMVPHASAGTSSYFYISKPTTGFKVRPANEINKLTGAGMKMDTIVQVVDHKGLKGYGVGFMELAGDKGPSGNNALRLNHGQHNLDCPRTFYDGEDIKKGDIIVFESYNDTPFIQCFDSSPSGAFFTRLASKGRKDKVSNSIYDTTTLLKEHGMQCIHDTPIGRNFFIYRHRGLIDESLDGFCTLKLTSEPAIEAKVNNDASTGESLFNLRRDSIFSYDGRFYRHPHKTFANGGIFGMFADYNGLAAPSGAIISKVIDKRLPLTLTLANCNTSALDGVYTLDQYPVADGINHGGASDEGNSPAQAIFIGQSAYGSNLHGDIYYKQVGNSPKRIFFNRTSSVWQVTDGSTTANFATGSLNSATGEYTVPTAGNNVVDTSGDLTYTDVNSPRAPIEIHLIDATTKLAQPLVQDLKAGFGVTITTSANKSKVKYQCFPPTDTAPPFRATITGLRTIPEGLAGDGSDSTGSVIISHASPGAGASADKPITSIRCTGLKFSGSYGNNSPGVNDTPSVAGAGVDTSFELHNTSVDNRDGLGTSAHYQPGGVLELGANSGNSPLTNFPRTYNKQIRMEFITVNGDTQTFDLLGSTASNV